MGELINENAAAPTLRISTTATADAMREASLIRSFAMAPSVAERLFCHGEDCADPERYRCVLGCRGSRCECGGRARVGAHRGRSRAHRYNSRRAEIKVEIGRGTAAGLRDVHLNVVVHRAAGIVHDCPCRDFWRANDVTRSETPGQCQSAR